MKIAFLGCLYLLLLFFASSAWSQPLRLPCGNTTCTTYRVDLTTQQLLLLYKDADGSRFASIAGLEKAGRLHGRPLKFATNAGIFTRAFSPLGLTVIEGREIRALNQNDGSGNFYLKPNGVFYISNNHAHIVETSRYVPAAVSLATQSGPLLVNQGKIHPAFRNNSKNVHIRNAVGVVSDSQVVFVISDGPVNFHDLAVFFKDSLSCQNALYLDGIISKMYLPELGRAEKGGDFAAMFAVYEEAWDQHRD